MAEIQNSVAIVRQSILAAFQPFISKEETRYYLRGVHIEGHPVQGAVLVATDGHMMAVAHDPDGYTAGLNQVWAVGDMGYLLKSKLPKLNRYMDPPEQSWVKLSVNPLLKLDARGSIHHAQTAEGLAADDAKALAHMQGPLAIDGVFPPWRRVVPNRMHAEPIRRFGGWLDATYMMRCTRFAVELSKAFGRQANPGVSFHSMESDPEDKHEGPRVMRISGTPEAFIVVMPIRGDDPETLESGEPAKGPPEWLYAKAPKKARKVKVPSEQGEPETELEPELEPEQEPEPEMEPEPEPEELPQAA